MFNFFDMMPEKNFFLFCFCCWVSTFEWCLFCFWSPRVNCSRSWWPRPDSLTVWRLFRLWRTCHSYSQWETRWWRSFWCLSWTVRCFPSFWRCCAWAQWDLRGFGRFWHVYLLWILRWRILSQALLTYYFQLDKTK